MRSTRGPVEVPMGPKSAIPVLLLLLGSLGCRTAAPVPPLASLEEPAPEELRLYAVADLLGKFDSVPKRGCCVMPVPATASVVFPTSWVIFGRGQQREPTGTGAERGAALRRNLELRGLAAKEDAERRRMDTERSSILEEPGDALLDHLRSRFVGGNVPSASCILSMRNGSDLAARGSPAALALVEQALAELR